MGYLFPLSMIEILLLEGNIGVVMYNIKNECNMPTQNLMVKRKFLCVCVKCEIIQKYFNLSVITAEILCSRLGLSKFLCCSKGIPVRLFA